MNHPFNHQESIWMPQGELGLEMWPGWRPEVEPYEDGSGEPPALRRQNNPGRLASGLEPSRATDSYFLCHPDLCLAGSQLLEPRLQRGRSCLRC